MISRTTSRDYPAPPPSYTSVGEDEQGAVDLHDFTHVTPTSSASSHLHQTTLERSIVIGNVDQQRNSIAPTIEDTFACTSLHDMADALNSLSQAAEKASHLQEQFIPQNGMTESFTQPLKDISQGTGIGVSDGQYLHSAVIPYYLITAGLLTVDQVEGLVARYIKIYFSLIATTYTKCFRFAKFYHPYLPIAPRKSLLPSSLYETARYEPHLLTAMITVAAKDLCGGIDVLQICSTYMNQLISEIGGGKRCEIEAVEALLLLAEWEPQSSLSNIRDIGCGEEDLSAWMHVGLALRMGYFLRLDRTSFKNNDEEKMIHFSRRRTAWAGMYIIFSLTKLLNVSLACYISDRQISVRIGRAFWSRGPGPITILNRQDFPSLQPQFLEEDDYASIMQATLELTQIFSNVHDVLYSGMGSSMKMMLVGSYVKYIDDFRTSIDSWKSVWGTLTCEILLNMAYYLFFLSNS